MGVDFGGWFMYLKMCKCERVRWGEWVKGKEEIGYVGVLVAHLAEEEGDMYLIKNLGLHLA